jgi:hypothetical protein
MHSRPQHKMGAIGVLCIPTSLAMVKEHLLDYWLHRRLNTSQGCGDRKSFCQKRKPGYLACSFLLYWLSETSSFTVKTVDKIMVINITTRRLCHLLMYCRMFVSKIAPILHEYGLP